MIRRITSTGQGEPPIAPFRKQLRSYRENEGWFSSADKYRRDTAKRDAPFRLYCFERRQGVESLAEVNGGGAMNDAADAAEHHAADMVKWHWRAVAISFGGVGRLTIKNPSFRIP
jgi:hypothetical protein